MQPIKRDERGVKTHFFASEKESEILARQRRKLFILINNYYIKTLRKLTSYVCSVDTCNEEMKTQTNNHIITAC